MQEDVKEKVQEGVKEIKTGTVIWFSSTKGIGFIEMDDGGKDQFVHWTQIVMEPGKYKTLEAGQRVQFTIGANKNGPQAENVTVVADDVIKEG